MIKKIPKKAFSIFKFIYGRIYSISKVNAYFDGDPNMVSLSTLQSFNSKHKEKDDFYVQTQIRIFAHIAEKDLMTQPKRPRFKKFAGMLAVSLRCYEGKGIASIENARNILKKYEDKYGTS
jgi:hypothetical protein